MSSLQAPADETTAVGPPQPWRRRFVRKLLYGANVDRRAKASARVGLALIAFSLVYAVIGARLVIFGITADPNAARRFSTHDRVATARPDILDRCLHARPEDDCLSAAHRPFSTLTSCMSGPVVASGKA